MTWPGVWLGEWMKGGTEDTSIVDATEGVPPICPSHREILRGDAKAQRKIQGI